MTRPTANRRRTPRIAGNVRVTWRRGARTVELRAINVNAHGMLLRTEETIAINHVMDLTVHLPGGDASIMAVSRFCGDTQWGHAIGVAIHVVAPNDQAAWLRYYNEAAHRTSI